MALIYDNPKKDKTCCFTGHREIPLLDLSRITRKTRETVLSLYSRGVRYFGAGGAIGFDTIAAETVLELRETLCPEIKLILVLPCRDQTRGWKNERDLRRYAECLRLADKVVYTSDEYHRGCMHKRNRHLVDQSAYCIAYLTKPSGGTAYTVDYAEQRGLVIIKIE